MPDWCFVQPFDAPRLLETCCDLIAKACWPLTYGISVISKAGLMAEQAAPSESSEDGGHDHGGSSLETVVHPPRAAEKQVHAATEIPNLPNPSGTTKFGVADRNRHQKGHQQRRSSCRPAGHPILQPCYRPHMPQVPKACERPRLGFRSVSLASPFRIVPPLWFTSMAGLRISPRPAPI